MDKRVTLPPPCFRDKKEAKDISLKPYTAFTKSSLMPGLVSTGYVQSKLTMNEGFRRPIIPPKDNFVPIQQQFHFSSPQGMLQPSSMQPPPMYGPRGPTIPPRYMNVQKDVQSDTKYWCDICDKEFYSKSHFAEHQTEHKVCGIEGCSFTGDTLMLANHIEHTHSNGLYNTIKKLNTPEEIAKWREERRKRYPTRANVELRQRAQEEKMKRGERITKRNNRFGDKSERRPIRRNEPINQKNTSPRLVENLKSDNKRQAIPRKVGPQKPSRGVRAPQSDCEELCTRKFRKFGGTSTLKDYFRPKQIASKQNPLSCLLSMYNSEDESDCDVGEDVQDLTGDSCETDENALSLASVTTAVEESVTTIESAGKAEIEDTLKPEDSDNDAPEELAIQRTEERMPEEHDKSLSDTQADRTQPITTPEATLAGKHRKRFKRRGNKKIEDPESEQKKVKMGLLDYSKLRHRRQNTMLEKLLEPDIIHERNVLLQCVRFVVENNFFDVGSKTSV